MNKSNNAFLIAVLLLPFFDPPILSETEAGMPDWMSTVILVWQCISILISFLLIPSVWRFHKLEKNATAIIALFFSLVVSTIICGNSVIKPLFYLTEIIAIISICYYFIFVRNDLITVLKVLSIYFTALVFFDFISIVSVPGSHYVMRVFGSKNNHIYYLIPFIFFYLSSRGLNREISGFKVYFPIICSLIIAVLLLSTTTLFSLALVLLGTFFYLIINRNKKTRRHMINVRIVYIVSIAISILFVVSEEVAALDMLVAYFDKEDTFGRISIWQNALEYIKESPLFGSGIEPEELMHDKFHFEFSQCHNKFVDILYMGGFIGLFFFVSAIFSTFKKLNCPSKLLVCLSVVLCAYSVEFLTEGKRIDLAFYLLLLLYPIILDYQTKIISKNEFKL